MTLEEARAAFPVLERLAYLNAGTFGPLARSTADALTERVGDDLGNGRGGRATMERSREIRTGARERIAALLGVDPGLVALTNSTTQGCNIVVGGLRLTAGDEVVTTDHEHFGLLGALGASVATVRVATIGGRPAAQAVDAILAEVTPRTKLVAVSHVVWTTGQVIPIHELRERSGLPVLVDGAQSGGAIPVQATGVDFYTVSGQKWLCGPDATGGLYVADPERLHVSTPSYMGQSAHEPDGSFTPREGAARFDPGGLPGATLSGFIAALDGHPAWRFERGAEMAAHCRELLLAEGFDVVTEPDQGTLVSVDLGGDEEAADAAARAYEQGVLVRSLPGRGWLRVSCGYWTNEDDYARLAAALAPVRA
jgi:L-cysteine/cystine lyase